jgi:hypothetical protein
MIRLATTDYGAPVRLYANSAGEILAADGRRIDWTDVSDLIVANASQAIQLAAHGRLVTAKRFARDALDLHDAWVAAKLYRSASQPTALDRAKADEAGRGK